MDALNYLRGGNAYVFLKFPTVIKPKKYSCRCTRSPPISSSSLQSSQKNNVIMMNESMELVSHASVQMGHKQGPVVVIDNYDSFTYNLCQYLGDLGCEYTVYRNDDITLQELQGLNPRGVLISPGPGTPEDSGISLDVVRILGPNVPLFGVCMGLQCMGQAFGGDIVRAPGGVMHGKTSNVFHNQSDAAEGDGLLAGLPSPFTACRYHSLVIDNDTFPKNELEVTAWTEDGLVMGVRHHKYRHVEGVQFHPESIITHNGKKIVANFVKSLDRMARKHQH